MSTWSLAAQSLPSFSSPCNESISLTQYEYIDGSIMIVKVPGAGGIASGCLCCHFSRTCPDIIICTKLLYNQTFLNDAKSPNYRRQNLVHQWLAFHECRVSLVRLLLMRPPIVPALKTANRSYATAASRRPPRSGKPLIGLDHVCCVSAPLSHKHPAM